MNWNDVTLYKFQRIDDYNNSPIDELGKALFATCVMYDKTEAELDVMNVKKVNSMAAKVGSIFQREFIQQAVEQIGIYKVEYNPARLRFGQYVELSFFLQMPITKIAHYVLASITRVPFRKNNSGDHKKKSDKFLQLPVAKALGSVSAFIERFNDFNKEYSALFGVNEEVSGDVQNDKFNKRYGWTYSASVIAEHHRIPLNDVFNMNVREALNALVYLKEKALYDKQQLDNGRQNSSR